MITKILGPYNKSDGRQFVIVYYSDRDRRHVSYAKFLMEQRLGRDLDPNLETIHHVDGDIRNNSIDNLAIIPRSEHSKTDANRLISCKSQCAWCKKEMDVSKRQRWRSQKRRRDERAGPFCSCSCAGKYGMERRYRGIGSLRSPVEKKFQREGISSATVISD